MVSQAGFGVLGWVWGPWLDLVALAGFGCPGTGGRGTGVSQAGFGVLGWVWWPRLGLVALVGFSVPGWVWCPWLGLMSQAGFGVPGWVWWPWQSWQRDRVSSLLQQELPGQCSGL